MSDLNLSDPTFTYRVCIYKFLAKKTEYVYTNTNKQNKNKNSLELVDCYLLLYILFWLENGTRAWLGFKLACLFVFGKEE